ncbi:MAG: type II toxin-antitoxin system RelE/ParE family toxin, partial [Xanthomonadaceae bacterium]|nr:type II toxin-antitoxin system RelE/ParE family toxin [Xanthomonadaceae bacterium]
LKACFENLAENPTIGRRAEQLAKGLRRFEHRSHIVFYVLVDDAVLVVRVLHYRMVHADISDQIIQSFCMHRR